MGWPRRYFACPYVFQQGIQQYYCLICGCVIYGYSSFSGHINGKRHTESLEQYGCDISALKDDYYYCSCCDCVIPYYTNVFGHIMGKRHQSTLYNDLRKTFWDSCGYFECPFVFNEGSDNYYCLLCGCYMSDRAAFQSHIDGKLHADSVKTFGSYISPIGEDYFYCRQCYCNIPHYKNIHPHIIGQRHQNAMYQSEIAEEVGKGEINASKEKIMNSEFADSSESAVFCEGIYKHIIERQDQSSFNDTNDQEVTRLETIFINSSVFKPDSSEHKIAQSINETSEAFPGFYNYTILRRSVENDNRQICCSLHEPPRKLDLSSWQLSSCKDLLQYNSSVKDDATNSNLKKEHQENASKASLSELNPPKSVEDNLSPKVSTTNNVEQFSTDVNGNNTSKNTQKKYLDDRDIAEMLIISKVNDFLNANPVINGIDDEINPPSLKSGASISSDDSSWEQSAFSRKQGNLDEASSSESSAEEDIYEMSDKKSAVRLGLKLCFVKDENTIYCLICDKFISAAKENYLEHLNDLKHCENLNEQKKDHALFQILPGEYSKLFLAHQYMIEQADYFVYCMICNRKMLNINSVLENHIEEDWHVRIREKMHEEASQCFELLEPQLRCDWYKIYKYRCFPCSFYFDSEIKFIEHLMENEHIEVTKRSIFVGRELIYDCCTLCGILWYGHCRDSQRHNKSSKHVWLALHAKYETKSADELLAEPEEYLEDAMKCLENVFAEEEKKNKILIDDLEKTVRMIFPRAKAYTLRSKLNGLAPPDENINVFLDCGDMYDEKLQSLRITDLIKIVQKRLSDESLLWKTEELKSCRTIRVYHTRTQLSCQISFDNEILMGNYKLIKFLFKIFPMSRKLMVFLQQWLISYNLSGIKGFSSYALNWLVVFFLQKESILPSIALLSEMEQKSRITDGWVFGVDNDKFPAEVATSKSIKEYLMKFFKFYANFDFRYNVACPLIGDVVKRRAFADLRKLPKEMKSYITYMKGSNFSESFSIETAVCIQDPFDLRENLTKNVIKLCLNRFRTCCMKSLNSLKV